MKKHIFLFVLTVISVTLGSLRTLGQKRASSCAPGMYYFPYQAEDTDNSAVSNSTAKPIPPSQPKSNMFVGRSNHTCGWNRITPTYIVNQDRHNRYRLTIAIKAEFRGWKYETVEKVYTINAGGTIHIECDGFLYTAKGYTIAIRGEERL